MAYALDDAASLLMRLRDVGHTARDNMAPAGGSPGAAEIATVTEGQRKYLLDLTSTAAVRFVATEDLLFSLGQAIRTPEIIVGTVPPARTAAELAAALCWLLDPEVSAHHRLRRVLGDRHKSLSELMGLPMPGAKDQAQERRAAVMASAQSVGIAKEDPPGPTDLVAWAFGDDTESDPDIRDVGRIMYKLAAGTAHGTLYALHRSIKPVQGAQGDPLLTALDGQVWGRM